MLKVSSYYTSPPLLLLHITSLEIEPPCNLEHTRVAMMTGTNLHVHAGRHVMSPNA
jgi:hypothetical protein